MQTREQYDEAQARAPRTTIAEAGWSWRSYQKKFLRDTSRLVCVIKSRQIGMSEAAAALAVKEAMDTAKRSVWIVSVNLASAKEVLRKCNDWARALHLCDARLPRVISESTEKIELSNGARICVLPCMARAVRGKTGTVIIDEAAHIPNDEAIWTAVAPVIVSNRNLRIIMISTPFGARGVFYRAATGALDGPSLKWSIHFIDVNAAVAAGFPREVLDLRSSYTEDAWAQEFLCSFLAQQGKYFPANLLTRCYEAELPPDEERVVKKRALAIDCASKADSAVAAIIDFDGDDCYHFHSPTILSEAKHRREYPEQYAMIQKLVELWKPDYIVVDANGVGAGIASFLKAEFGACVIETIPTAPWKAKNIPALKVDMQNGKIEIEPDQTLTLAFNSVRERRTAANATVFEAARDEHGHADGFSACLLGYAHLKVWPPAKSRGTKVVAPRASKTSRDELRQY